MKTWTVEQMLAERPCPQYTEEALTKLWAGRGVVSLPDILNMEIPDVDKMWGSWRGLTKKQTGLVLEKIITRAVTNHALHCGVLPVEKWADGWLSEKDRSAEAAGAAARAAWAVEAAWAAWAAEAAAWAAWAAGAAARAAGAAARAAGAAARATMQEKILKYGIKLLRG